MWFFDKNRCMISTLVKYYKFLTEPLYVIAAIITILVFFGFSALEDNRNTINASTLPSLIIGTQTNGKFEAEACHWLKKELGETYKGNIEVLNRNKIGELIQAIQFSRTPFSDPNTSITLGKFKNPNYLIILSVNFSNETNHIKQYGLDVKTDKIIARLTITLIEVSTTKEITEIFTGEAINMASKYGTENQDLRMKAIIEASKKVAYSDKIKSIF